MSCVPLGQLGGNASPELWAFTGPWDPRSLASAARHGAQLDVLVSGWIALDSATANPVSLFADTLRIANGPRRFALVTSWHGERVHPESIRRIGSDPARQREVAGAVAELAQRGGYEGLVLHFEALSRADLGSLLRVARAIADSARARGVLEIAIAVPATDTAAYPTRPLLTAADLVLVMLYDQHWRGSPPGPVAAPDWARRHLALRISDVGADRLVAAFPFYGYLWRRGASTEIVGFDDARRIAAEGGVTLEREPATATLRASRPDSWEMWVSDAVLVRELVEDARVAGVRRFAFWHLGLEDSRVWGMLGR